MELFNTYYPQPFLSPFIQNYWVLEIDTVNFSTERSIPTGYLQLLFHRELPLTFSAQNRLQPKSFISGMSTDYTDISYENKVNMFVVSFRPQGAAIFLNLPLNLTHNSHLSLEDTEDDQLKELGKQICEEPNNLKCIQLIENFMLKRLANFDLYNLNRILPAIQIIGTEATIKITSLSDSACLSEKQFNRIFTHYIGATPKEFHRIIRFQRTLFLMQKNPSMQLTSLAVEAGYYDQSHLIREFKQFSGYTPTEYLQLCAPYSDYFTNY